MKQGFYFRIPEGPDDMQQLWDEAELLNEATLPDWLDPEEAEGYRWVNIAPPNATDSDRSAAYLADLKKLESAGLIVDPEIGDGGPHRVYITAPRKDQVWSIGIYEGASPFRLVPSLRVTNPVLTSADITDVSATFVADPFVLQVAGIWYMFFEVLNWETGKGEIGLATSSDTYHWQYQQIVLDEPFHLSYPYVFIWEGDYYMIPESHSAGDVRLYRAVDFPTRWTLAATLLTGGYFADASPFRFDGRWWMFVDTSSSLAHDTLRLYYADELAGRWREHPASPVVCGNPQLARPAGRVLVDDQRIVRFAQNCSPEYGLDVRAFEITVLTPTDYQEREIGPNPVLAASGQGWNACGMHHVDPLCRPDGDWWAAVDGWAY